MTVDVVRELSGEVFKTILMVAGPTLLVSLIVGLIISLFQAITQIQEITITFVPKIVAVFFCIFLLFPWMSNKLMTFTITLIDRIPLYVR